MLIKNLKEGKYQIESNGENGKTSFVLYEGAVEIEGAPFKIDTAGEYEIKGIHVYGINGGKDKKPIFLTITGEKIKVAYIGILKESLSEAQIEELSDTDILFTLLTDENIKAIEKIEPNILIPVNHTLELLQKYFSGITPKILDKLNIKSKDELTEEMEIVLL